MNESGAPDASKLEMIPMQEPTDEQQRGESQLNAGPEGKNHGPTKKNIAQIVERCIDDVLSSAYPDIHIRNPDMGPDPPEILLKPEDRARIKEQVKTEILAYLGF